MNGEADDAAAAAAAVPMAVDDNIAEDMQTEPTVGTVPAVEVLQPINGNEGVPYSPCAHRVCPDRRREPGPCMASCINLMRLGRAATAGGDQVEGHDDSVEQLLEEVPADVHQKRSKIMFSGESGAVVASGDLYNSERPG